MIRKILFTVMLIAAVMFAAGTAMADCTASWVSPADGSSYPVGTLVDLTGQAGASGSVGGTGLDLALVIDTSGSMGWSPDYTLNNYAKPAAIALVNALPADTTSVAVIGFNSSANTYQVLTALNPNKQDVIDAINSLIDGGGTNIGSGVAEATTTLLSGNTAGRAMMQVVLSDGFGSYNDEAETAYDVYGQVVHTVGVPGHDPDLMQEIATDGHGIYTNVSDLSTLIGIFDGTGGSLVGLDYVLITLPDGTVLNSDNGDFAVDGLGNFILPDWVIQSGAQTFTAQAFCTAGESSSPVTLTLNGTTTGVPEPTTMLLLGFGLLGLVGFRRKQS